jgi:MFS family permease
VAVLINTFGTGLLLTSLPLYFTEIVNLSAAQVGLGLTIATVVRLLVGLPVGELTDRLGPLQVVKAMLLLEGAATFAFIFVDSFASFLIFAVVNLVAGRTVVAAEGALLRRVAGDDAASFRSSTHAITNVGLSVGFALCGIAIQLGTRVAYNTLIIVDVLSFVAAWAVLRKLPRYEPLPRPAAAPRWGVLRDRPFVAFASLGTVFSLQFTVLTPFLALWVVEQTNAPRWCIPLSLVINTILVVLLQVRIGGGVRTLQQGGLAWRRAGVFFLLSCTVLGLAAGLPAWAALTAVVAAIVLHTFGEILHMASGFALSMGLPPAHAQAQYDALGGIIGGLGSAAAPALLLGVVLSLGQPGLFALGALFFLTSTLMPAVARWGERTRPATPDPVAGKAAAVVE